ncbi:hypothetical protein EDD18DRAFT_1128073 [Armillaria luteobubalina]|uniref:Uncharacterized protein n=1 Tax=Armillaria luteobubalina TaxID=153913 RepID=A0AA39V4F1_9AGAR|nr:hypothetical protein EDD18DRAFT_1128073 [Armillaria luteobubalina]
MFSRRLVLRWLRWTSGDWVASAQVPKSFKSQNTRRTSVDIFTWHRQPTRQRLEGSSVRNILYHENRTRLERTALA